MGSRTTEDAKGSPQKTGGRKEVELAQGTPASWARELCRVQVVLPDSTFELFKRSAIKNNRSLSMEARTMIECAIRAQDEKE